MEKIAVFKLIKINEAPTFELIKSSDQHLSKSLSVFDNQSLPYYFSEVSPNLFLIWSYDEKTNDDRLIGRFYHLNKNFLYGELYESGKCLYGILGDTMHRKFNSTDLMLIEDDMDFKTLETTSDYPTFCHNQRQWDKAMMAKAQLYELSF